MKKALLTLSLLVALAAAAAGGYFWNQFVHQTTTNSNTAAPAGPTALYWYDPMTPTQHFNHPGKSPLMPSMDLVPKYADQNKGNTSTVVHIDPRIEQNLGLRTAVVHVATLTAQLQASGILEWDRRRSVIVSARTDGVLTHLFVRAPFDHVHAGQVLGILLSPAWSAAAAELGVLSDTHSNEAQSLRSAALERLHVMGMSPAEIRQLSADPTAGVMIRSPASGVISTLAVAPGQSVSAGTTLMRIDDPGRLWLTVGIPQSEVSGIGAGTPANIVIDAFPGHIFKGKIEAMLPDVDARTRTQSARIVLDNPDDLLAPGMFASVSLKAVTSKPYPLVPDEALINTGTQIRVILDLGGGHLEPRLILPGNSNGGYTEVLAGLNGGEHVVLSGEFLFDSEADLNGALNRLTLPAAPATLPAQHKVLYWYDPMAPAKQFSHGGPSPLMPSMNLVPRYADQPAPAGAQP